MPMTYGARKYKEAPSHSLQDDCDAERRGGRERTEMTRKTARTVSYVETTRLSACPSLSITSLVSKVDIARRSRVLSRGRTLRAPVSATLIEPVLVPRAMASPGRSTTNWLHIQLYRWLVASASRRERF